MASNATFMQLTVTCWAHKLTLPHATRLRPAAFTWIRVVVMSHGTTVLLIDDDPHYRDYYAYRLHASSAHYDVVHAATGRSGLAIVGRQPIDCIVLEIDLPDMSGFEVLGKLVPRTYRPEIAVIVLTRLSNRFLLDLAVKNGAQAAFQKTLGSGDLLEQCIPKAISMVQDLNKILVSPPSRRAK